jgi:hypothetical protein
VNVKYSGAVPHYWNYVERAEFAQIFYEYHHFLFTKQIYEWCFHF